MASIRTDSAIAGGAFAGTIFAPAMSSVATFVGDQAPALPTLFGELWVAGPLTIIDAGVVPASGERTFDLTSGNTTPNGFSLTVQAIVLHDAELWLSTPGTPVFER